MRRPGGFTLFEVLTSIAIFLLLAGGIFTSVRSAFVASASIRTAQLDSERAEAFQQFLRRFFLSLPADAKVEMRLRREGGMGDVVEVLAWPVPPFLRFGTNAEDGIALAARPDGRGGFRLSLAYFRAEDPPDVRDRKITQADWMPLLPEVREIRWRFAPARNPVLSETWNSGSGRPGLAELSLRMANGQSGVYSYWIPPLQRRSSGAGEDSGAPPPAGGRPPGPQQPEEGGAEAPSPPEEGGE